MGNERTYDRVSWAEGSVRTCWEARGYQSPGGASAQRDGCSYRLQSHRLGGQPLGSICRLSEAASLYVEAGAVQFACRQMDLGAGRIICSRPRGAVQGLDQDRPRPAEEWRNPVDLPERDAERSKYFVQARCRHGRASRRRSHGGGFIIGKFGTICFECIEEFVKLREDM